MLCACDGMALAVYDCEMNDGRDRRDGQEAGENERQERPDVKGDALFTVMKA